jgi:uncharacterized protein involved in exopolysaccharide biosynthesis
MLFTDLSSSQPQTGVTAGQQSISSRDVVIVLFRRYKFILASFVLVFLVFVSFGFLTPQYRGEMKVLVRRDRLDPIVSSQQSAPVIEPREAISEEEVNSEVELLKGEDLLQKVAVDLELYKREHLSLFSHADPQRQKIARAVKHLATRLSVRPLQKTNIITIRYEADSPDQAKAVLDKLSELYLAKHLAVHRPSGELLFFDQQANKYSQGLADAESKLRAFSTASGTAAALQERDLSLQRLSEFNAEQRQTQASLVEIRTRIANLTQQEKVVPPRQTTQARTGDNGQLLQTMKGALLQEQKKRSQLLSEFKPAYKAVTDQDRIVSQTEEAIKAELTLPLKDETTDLNPVFTWVESELAKSRAELEGLAGKSASLASSIADYHEAALTLQQHGIYQQDLSREVKVQEDNYLLYLRKREEARMNEALDRRRIMNVALAEDPTVGPLPVRSLPTSLAFVLLIGGILSITGGFARDMLDGRLRTPEHIYNAFGTHPLASLPNGYDIPPQLVTGSRKAS